MHKGKLALFCPLQGVIDIISKKWALLVINEIGNHKTIRFNELRRELRDVTAKSLANTLYELQSNNIVVRKDKGGIPPKTEYSLTEEGLRLYQIIIPLLQWAASRKNAIVTRCSCKAK